jgi:hypothetical protein
MKNKHKKWAIIIGVIAILILSINIILGSIVSKVVNKQLEKINKKGVVIIKIEDVNIDIITSSLTLKNMSVSPDSLSFENFKVGKANKPTFSKIFLKKLKIKGFSIFKILLFDEIIAKKIIVDGMKLTLYKSNLYHKKKATKKPISIDSIFIEGVKKIDLSKIEFFNLDFEIIDIQKNEPLFSYTLKECEIDGIDLDTDDNNYFKLNKEDLKINLKKQQFNLTNGNYAILFDEINYNYGENSISISNFKFKPTISKFKLAQTYKYNKEVFTVETKKINFYGFYLDSILNTGTVIIDSLVVDALNLDIFKNQTKPFDLNKRPKFINQTLKNLEQPINIGLVIVKNSVFKYQEKHKNSKELMTVDITDFNAEINFITSIKDSLKTAKELTINLKGNLCKVAPVNIDIFMPYNTWNNSFSFTGSVGKGNFTAFNQAIYPATGLKFKDGTLNSIQFNVQGTPTKTNGKMSMLYSGLKANLASEKKQKKGLNWLANSILLTENPSEKGKLRIALIEFERVQYKGFGNLLWKSVMSGLVNTVVPFGKHVKPPKEVNQSKKHFFKKKK